MTDAELDAIEARAGCWPRNHADMAQRGFDSLALAANLRSARKRIAAAEAIAADWLQAAVADMESPASPAIAALTHDIQQALRGDD